MCNLNEKVFIYDKVSNMAKEENMKKWIRVELITNYLKANKISKSEFCKRVGISVGVLNKILSHNLNFRIDAIWKIAKEIKTNTMFYY